MIRLKVENHFSEYELQNIINVFEPYLETSSVYKVISRLDGTKCIATMLKDEKVIVECWKIVDTESLSTKEQESKIKRTLKNTLYKVLLEITNQNMPWGILTGIRPTKIIHKYISKGYSQLDISEILKEEYCISQEKINLMLEVAKKEEQVMAKNKKEEVSIYIGIPFCPTRCLYCSFTSYSLEKKSQLVDLYLDSLIKELKYVARSTKNKPIRSLYIGGGTPTSLNERQLEKLLLAIDNYFDISSIEEYTVEAGRPDTINREKLSIMKKYSVGRISINPQTMNQKTLEVIGRKHSVHDIVKVFKEARQEGHNNINMDLIIGLPGETVNDVAYTMEEISKLNPESITLHTMSIKRASRLKEEQSEYNLAPRDDIEKMLYITSESAKNMGMEPYYMYRQKDILGNFENVGYAIKGKECIYNIQMIAEQETIIAVGAGAVTKIVSDSGEGIKRIPNVKNVEDYINRIDEMIERKRQVLG